MSTFTRLSLINKEDITFKRIFAAFIRRIVNIYYILDWKKPFGFPSKNKIKLQGLHNCHIGKRCFIIANGPSLKYIDFSHLKNEITIGMNRIYLMKEQNGFIPNYLVCIDKKTQLRQFTEDYDNIEIPCFYNFDLHRMFSKKENQYFIKSKFRPDFSVDIVKDPMGNGKSVTYACLQLAYYMGMKEVFIIGKDHSYNTTLKAGTGIKSSGIEENHFIKGYYKKGQNWDAPDYISEEYAYTLTRKAFEKDGRIVKDATVDGKLEVFEKVDFYSLFT